MPPSYHVANPNELPGPRPSRADAGAKGDRPHARAARTPICGGSPRWRSTLWSWSTQSLSSGGAAGCAVDATVLALLAFCSPPGAVRRCRGARRSWSLPRGFVAGTFVRIAISWCREATVQALPGTGATLPKPADDRHRPMRRSGPLDGTTGRRTVCADRGESTRRRVAAQRARPGCGTVWGYTRTGAVRTLDRAASDGAGWGQRRRRTDREGGPTGYDRNQ
jgi:hypothetical protein